ncbi:unnamed protein product [Strongylus vulgaris]|uniref:Uncharacterized protein n=1 Tax=Strongylus vulgaris TaxID=40348 RepID=A0A3P7KZ85_STRVU|nr:unnamed protein product [Strongylus vulgaris]
MKVQEVLPRNFNDVAELYAIKPKNVVGNEQDILGRIIEFVLAQDNLPGHGTISTRSTHGPQSTCMSTTPLRTQAPPSKTTPKTPVPPVEPTTTENPPIKRNCLFVGDLYNYQDNGDFYRLEAELLNNVGYDIFEETASSRIALWAYGYTDFPQTVNASLEDMSEDYEQFAALLIKMKYVETSSAISTRSAIEAINVMYDTKEQLDCLVFLTAQKNTEDLPQIAPRNVEFKTVVVVGLNGTLINWD